MKTLAELADTKTTDVDQIRRIIWSEELEKTATARRVARNFVRINRDLQKTKAKQLKLPVASYQAISASATTEGAAISTTTLDYSKTVTLDPVEIGAAVGLTKEVIEEVCIDIVRDATDQLAEALAQKEDQDILSQLASATGNVITATGQKFETKMIASGLQKLREDNYNGDVLFISPAQELELLKDPQFTDASKYGDQTVIKTGEIGKWLGVTVVVTTNVPGTATDRKCLLFDSRHAAVLAIARDAEIETDYDILKRVHYIVGTAKYDCKLLIDDAVCVIRVQD